ncbi:MAG: hypothetical protein Q7R64_02865 [bacterium]|nr:hypothetical protein [bacterium]
MNTTHLNAAHFVEGKIAVAVLEAERTGDTVRISREVKAARPAEFTPASPSDPSSHPSRQSSEIRGKNV